MKWAAVIPIDDAHQLAALRQLGDVEVCPQGRTVWLRGTTLDDAIALAMRKVSGAQRFLLSGTVLTPVGSRVPTGELPDGDWVLLSKYVVPEAPTAALPADGKPRVGLELVRASRELPANVLLTDLAAWVSYACEAPQIRLNGLSFAVSKNRQVIIRGQPLPPIQGTLLVEDNGIALPCGYRLQPEVDADIASAAFGIALGDLVVLGVDRTARIIAHESFIAASRSAARLTAQELANG